MFYQNSTKLCFFLVVEYRQRKSSSSSSGNSDDVKHKRKKAKTKQTTASSLRSYFASKLGTYTLQYVASLVGFVFVGNFLRDSLSSQLLFTAMFGLQLFWFSLRFDTVAGIKGNW